MWQTGSLYRKIDFPTFRKTLSQSGETAGTIMVMLFMVSILSRLYMTENLPDTILNTLTSISSNRIVLLLMINLFMIIIGMLMDDCSGTTLCGPILMPVMGALGVTPVQFAAILSVNIGRVAGAQVKDMLKPTFILIVFAWLPTLILTTFCSPLSLFLPKLLGYV